MERPDLNEIGEPSVLEFFQKIDEWTDKKLVKPIVNENEIFAILNCSMQELQSYNSATLLESAYMLYGYIEEVQKAFNEETCIKHFAEESIYHIISNKLVSYNNDYTKWPVKYYEAVKSNVLASKLNKLKINCESRLTMLSGRLDHLKKKADILLELSRRKY